MTRSDRRLAATLSLALIAAACSEDGPDGPIVRPPDVAARPDADRLDAGPDSDASDADEKRDAARDAGDASDVDAGDASDADAGDASDADASDGGLGTCPDSLRDSCLWEALSCFGGGGEIVECVRNTVTGRVEVGFASGASGVYEQSGVAGRRAFRVRSAQGESCYLARPVGDEAAWSVQQASGFVYQLDLSAESSRVTCPGGEEVEICTRAKFDLVFDFPSAGVPDPSICAESGPQDSCALDGECGAGEQCCALSGGGPRQCRSWDTCMPQRAARACVEDAECGDGAECARCTRIGRECVPAGYAASAGNALGCTPDTCDPTDVSACSDPRVCCLFGDAYRCAVAGECDRPPNLNPPCMPTSSAACSNPSQACCYVAALAGFHCIDDRATCRTDVCFADADCPGAALCCAANAAASIPGTCATQCDVAQVVCTNDASCAGSGLPQCCKYPGYTTGVCVSGPESCPVDACTPTGGECGLGESCCTAAPLSSGACITNSTESCPPEPY